MEQCFRTGFCWVRIERVVIRCPPGSPEKLPFDLQHTNFLAFLLPLVLWLLPPDETCGHQSLGDDVPHIRGALCEENATCVTAVLTRPDCCPVQQGAARLAFEFFPVCKLYVYTTLYTTALCSILSGTLLHALPRKLH